MSDLFAPYQTLADTVLGSFDADAVGGSHDLSHIVRVWPNAAAIARTEPVRDTDLLLVAALLHDCVPVERNSPRRRFASRLSAAQVREIVAPVVWTPDRVDALEHEIETHGFSAGLVPETLEAKIFKDADTLDAIGAVGIARCFHVGGRMGGALYEPNDHGAKARPLNDQAYALDHFAAQLFKVSDGFPTPEGRRMAANRNALMRNFVAAFLVELEGGGPEEIKIKETGVEGKTG